MRSKNTEGRIQEPATIIFLETGGWLGQEWYDVSWKFHDKDLRHMVESSNERFSKFFCFSRVGQA